MQQPSSTEGMPSTDRGVDRRRMIDEQIRARHVLDASVLAAMEAVPREHFLPESLRADAYADSALSIGEGQTISQPYIVAYMTATLRLSPACRVLEVGTGTGYQTAILARLAREVFTVERIEPLHLRAVRALAALSIANVTLAVGDGSLGWVEHAPFDRIIVTAAAPHVPQALVRQLAIGGMLVAPIGGPHSQRIVRVERWDGRTVETPMLPCRFVKLIGAEGWALEDSPPADSTAGSGE